MMTIPTLAERFPGLSERDMLRLTVWKWIYQLQAKGLAATTAPTVRLVGRA